MATKPNDTLGTVAPDFSANWDWKGEYVSQLNEDGYERFSQFSATPDTVAIFGGPARFTGLSGSSAGLLPIGLVDGINYSPNVQVARLFELGSNRSFFTRGKSAPTITLGQFLADHKNILALLSQNAYQPNTNIGGFNEPGADGANSSIMMNLDSEYFAQPFGMLMILKTRGGGEYGTGKILAGLYLEYCMFDGYNFSVNTSAPVIMQNVSIQFDRTVPVSFA